MISILFVQMCFMVQHVFALASVSRELEKNVSSALVGSHVSHLLCMVFAGDIHHWLLSDAICTRWLLLPGMFCVGGPAGDSQASFRVCSHLLPCPHPCLAW